MHSPPLRAMTWSLFSLRFVQGLLQGVCYPSLNPLTAKVYSYDLQFSQYIRNSYFNGKRFFCLHGLLYSFIGSVTSCPSVGCLVGRLVGRSFRLSFFPKRAESYTSMLLPEHLFYLIASFLSYKIPPLLPYYDDSTGCSLDIVFFRRF